MTRSNERHSADLASQNSLADSTFKQATLPPTPESNPSEFTDQQLILSCLENRDPDAAFNLVSRYEDDLKRFLRRRFGVTHETAEDIAQVAFTKAFKHLDKFDLSRPFRPWLQQIAANDALSLLRTEKARQAARELPSSAFRAGHRELSLQSLNADPGLGPNQVLLEREQNQLIAIAQRKLFDYYRERPDYQKLVQLVIARAPYSAIAEELQIPLGTAKSRISAVREKLAEILRSLGVYSSAA